MSTLSQKRNWDIMKSEGGNVYFLRNRTFENYFQVDDNKKVVEMPEAWIKKEVIWDSVGTLWAVSNDCCKAKYLEDDDEPLLDEKTQKEEKELQESIDYHIKKIREDTVWDYMLVYFENPENNEMGGYFDGVCTVSIRIPKKNNLLVNDAYLAIGSFTTEQSLSDEDNEKVTKGLMNAVLELGKNITLDIQELKSDSIWYKNNIQRVGMACVAFSTLSDSEYARLRNASAAISEDVYEHEFITFWKDKIGFEEPSRDDKITMMLCRYKTPFFHLFDYEDKTKDVKDTNSSLKKRKKYENKPNDSSSSSSSSDGNEGEDSSDAVLEDLQANVKLLVIKIA